MILAFFRLLRFKWLYSKWRDNVFQVVCGMVFLWSVWCLCADIGGSSGVVVLPGLLLSVIGLLKDVWGFVLQFQSKYDMFRYADRPDKNNLIKRWKEIQVDKTGFEIHPLLREEGSNGFDFVSYSKILNQRLTNNLEIKFEVARFRNTNCWKEINSCLSDIALPALALKLRDKGFNDFTNDRKVAIVSSLAEQLAKISGSQTPINNITIRIAESCYYATYLTNDSYCDCFYDPANIADRKFLREEWTPDGGNHGQLMDFDAPKSYHIGVNTLGITRDGRICTWTQKVGAWSVGYLSPTGSGSMDWSDVLHSKDKLLNTAIIYGAERELREESFDASTKEKFSKCGNPLESRIIGMYRWGTRGGLPGFVLVTLIPLNLGDICLPKTRCRGRKGECQKDSTKIMDIAPGLLMCEGRDIADSGISEWRKKCVDVVNKYRDDHRDELSVPLDVSLTFLIDALCADTSLDNNGSFVKWVYTFLDPKGEL